MLVRSAGKERLVRCSLLWQRQGENSRHGHFTNSSASSRHSLVFTSFRILVLPCSRPFLILSFPRSLVLLDSCSLALSSSYPLILLPSCPLEFSLFPSPSCILVFLSSHPLVLSPSRSLILLPSRPLEFSLFPSPSCILVFSSSSRPLGFSCVVALFYVYHRGLALTN